MHDGILFMRSITADAEMEGIPSLFRQLELHGIELGIACVCEDGNIVCQILLWHNTTSMKR